MPTGVHPIQSSRTFNCSVALAKAPMAITGLPSRAVLRIENIKVRPGVGRYSSDQVCRK